MVRPGALEQRSARRSSVRACGAATDTTILHLARFQFFGVSGFFSPPAQVYGITPLRVVGNVWLGTSGCALVSSRGAGVGVHLCGKRPGRSPVRRAGRRRMWGAWHRRGPGRRPAPTVGLGRGGARAALPGDVAGARRGLSEAPGGRSAGTLLAASRRPSDPGGIWLRFGRPFPAFEWPGDDLPSAAEEATASATTRAHFLCFERGRLIEKSGPGAACDPRSSRGAPATGRWAGSSAGGGEGLGCQPTSAAEEGPSSAGAASLALSVVWCLPDTMALAEVVVCAVGRVVTLPAVEITAQATALLVLVMLSAAEDNALESPLFSGAREQPPEARPARPPRAALVVRFPGGGKELQGEGWTGTFLKRV